MYLDKILLTFVSRIGAFLSYPKETIAPAVDLPIPGRVINDSISLGNLEWNLFLRITEEKFLKNGDVLVNSTGVGTLVRVAQFFHNEVKQITVDSHVTIVRPKKDMFAKRFFGYMMIMIENQIMNSGKGSSGQIELSRSELASMRVFYPNDKNIQQNIVNNLECEINLINANKKIIEIYNQKIQHKTDKFWGK